MGGGVTIFLSSGIKERPNVEYFSHFWDGYTATGAAALGFED